MSSGNSTAKAIAANTIYQFVGKFATMSITVLATMLIARLYGKHGYGEFSLMQNWPAIFFVIVDFGLNAIATRELSKDFSNASKYFSNILVIRILISTVFILLLYSALTFFPYSEALKFGIRLTLFLIPTQAFFTTANIIFQTKLRYDYSSISLVSGYGLILVLLLLFSNLRIPVVWISFSYVLGGIVTFLVSLRYLKKLGVSFVFDIDKNLWKLLFVQTLPIGIMFIFSQMNFKEDELLLSVLKLPSRYQLNNTETVAVYSLPYKVFDVALVLPTFFMNAVYPVMVRHMVEGKDKLKDTFFRSLKFLSLGAVGVGILGIVFAPLAVYVLGGEQFYQSITILRILVGGLIFYYLTQPISWLIVTLGKQIYLPFIYFAVAIVNLGLNLVYIPQYSFYAAAVITHISEAFILVLLVIFAYRAWKLKYA